MTAEELILDARSNRTGAANPDLLNPDLLSECLMFTLEHVLEELDYERDKKSSQAIAARSLACLITNLADLAPSKAVAS